MKIVTFAIDAHRRTFRGDFNIFFAHGDEAVSFERRNNGGNNAIALMLLEVSTFLRGDVSSPKLQALPISCNQDLWSRRDRSKFMALGLQTCVDVVLGGCVTATQL